MADEKPAGGAEAKDKQEKPAGRKLPPVLTKLTFEGILLVFVPFVCFLLVFLYTMGLVPPRAAIIELPVSGVEVAGSGQLAAPQGEAAATAPAGEAAPSATAETAPAPEITPAVIDSALTGKMPAPDRGTADAVVTRRAAADSITTALAQEKTKRVKQIAKVYEQMSAASVAAIVGNMPESEAVQILSLMSPRAAAKVLSVLDPEKAAKFSLELAQ